MRLFLKAIAALALLSVITNASLIDQSPAMADRLDKELSEIQAELYKRELAKSRLNDLRDAVNLQASDFACTGGVDPSKMNAKDYLAAFARGPCTPVIVLAGISGTKLQIQIDCQTLRANNPTVFDQCRWTSCTGLNNNIIGSTPKPEYTVWIPDITSPFSLANPRDKAKECFAGLLGIAWNQQGSSLYMKTAPGVRVLPLGMTAETKATSKCGFESISNILPIWQVLTPEKYRIFNAFRVSLEAKGYRLGLTATAVPYDWRIPFSHNGMASRMQKVLEAMKSITGKKVSIVAHSMGNINTLNMLSKMNQSDKDRLIQRYFALAPPYTGAPKSFSLLLGGSDEYQFACFGINFWGFKKMVATFSALYDLMPRTFWSRYDNAPWMKSIKNRVRTELGLAPSAALAADDDTVTRIFPRADAKCVDHDWTDRSGFCKSGLADLRSFGRILNDPITVDNMKYILGKYSYDKMAPSHFDDNGKRDSFDQMPNPGVETVIMYGNIVKTEKEYNYDFNPQLKTLADNADFVTPSSIGWSVGDGTVLTASATAPAIKWAWEFDHKVSGSKPVIFAELCSNYAQSGNVYQDQNNKSVTRNGYQGVACQCKKGNEKNCDHVGLVSDPNTVSFIVNSLMDKQIASSSRMFDTYTATQIDDFAKRCALVTDYN